MTTTPEESIGPVKAPDVAELPDPAAASGQGDTDGSLEPPASGDSSQQGSPVLDDSGQAKPGELGEPSS